MNIVGLDLSSTCSGVCLPDGQTEHFQPKGDLLQRALATKRWAADYILPADLVVIEAIGTRFVNAAIAIAYVHCQIDELLQDTRTIKVAPAELKKFATGKGNADKHSMTVAAIRNGWACDGLSCCGSNTTDDEADAWWLWALGCHMHGYFPAGHTHYRDIVVRKIMLTEEAIT